MSDSEITISHSIPKEMLPKVQVMMGKYNLRFISKPIILNETALLFYGTNSLEEYQEFSQKIEDILDRPKEEKSKNFIQRILTVPKPNV